MANLQDTQTELPPISGDDFPSSSKEELLKKQIAFACIAVVVFIICRLILFVGSGA